MVYQATTAVSIASQAVWRDRAHLRAPESIAQWWIQVTPESGATLRKRNGPDTGVYSFRLAMNLGSNDYFAALQRTEKPMAVTIAAGNDDQFYADRYAPLLQPAKPDLTVELVPGLDHVDMLMLCG